MFIRVSLAAAVLIGWALSPQMATAGGSYTVACGSGGSTSLIQTQLTAIAGTTGNSLGVTGTCSGTLVIADVDQLNFSGLTLNGDLVLSDSKNVNITGLTVTGTVTVTESRDTRFFMATVTGYAQVLQGSRVSFNQFALNPGTDSSGALAEGFTCSGMSTCNLDGFTLRGTPSSTAGSHIPGALAASGSTLTLASGTISGFDIGVQAWNHATALFLPSCANLNISGNSTMGVWVRDSGLIKAQGFGPAASSSSCPGQIVIASNGQYGVRSEGAGNAYLYDVQISGHSVDGVLVQDGASARVMSSTIDAASGTGLSARVRAQSVLWFDEDQNPPTGKSVLLGPVCSTGNSHVDTHNSSTQVVIEHSCGP